MPAALHRGPFAACLVAAGLLLPVPVLGQDLPDPGRDLNDGFETVMSFPMPDGISVDSRDEDEGSGRDLIIVPIPKSSPSLGFGITLVGSLFYNPNNSPEPWISGIGIMRTTNGSQAAGVMHKMALARDKFRLTALAAYADINVDFFGIGPGAGERGRSIELNEKGLAVIVQGQMRLFDHVYAGPRLLYIDISTSVNRQDRDPLFPDAEIPTAAFDTTLGKLGLVLSYDHRDNSLEPKSGAYITGAYMFGLPALGSDFSNEKFTIAGNAYRMLGRNTVIAGRVSYCGVTAGGPFYDLCLYGMSSDLRGYETGRYRDRGFWATQAELRQHLGGRWGAVAFAGVGESMPTPTDFGGGKFLPAVGAGIRWRPSAETSINMRLDLAWGKDGRAVYLSIGEAF